MLQGPQLNNCKSNRIRILKAEMSFVNSTKEVLFEKVVKVFENHVFLQFLA